MTDERQIPTSTDVLRSLRLLRSADPAERRRSIEVLSALLDDPRVSQVFEHLYERDPDPTVREMAWRALNQAGPSIPSPGPRPSASDAAPAAPPPPAARAPRSDAAARPAPPPPDAEPKPAPVDPAESDPFADLDDIDFPDDVPGIPQPPQPPQTAPVPVAPPRPEAKSRSKAAAASAAAPISHLRPRSSQPARQPARRAISAPLPGALFLLDDANAPIVAQERRRQAQRKRRGRAMLLVAAGLLLVAGIFWGLVLPRWYTWLRLERSGVTATAQIIELQQRGDDRYIALYRFTLGTEPDARAITDEQRITADDFRRLDQDTLTPVTYLPDSPDISRIAQDNPDDWTRNGVTFFAAALTVVAGGLVVFASVQGRLPRWLRRGRRVVRGQVLAASGRVGADGDYTVKIRYRFRAPDGKTLTAQSSRVRNDLQGRDLPAEGTRVAVLVRDERSFTLL